MAKKRAILWFRQDLRLHDNEALSEALRSADEIIPLYIFDDRVFGAKTKYGFPKTGEHRTRFIIESVRDLRNSLRELNSELYIRKGITEDIIYEIARETRSSFTFCNRERTKEEVEVQDALEKMLWTIGQEVRYSRGKMLYYTADLPFPVNHTPDQFSHFRKETERIIPIRPLIQLDAEIRTNTFKGLDPGELPTARELLDEIDEPSTIQSYRGGEMHALQRLNYFIWDKEYIKDYKEKQNNMVGECSSKLSPYLSQGCLSPKKVYHELMRYENERGYNDSTHELFHHLIYRDYLRFMAKKHGNLIFQYNGIRGSNPLKANNDWEQFEKWAKGETGNEFVDANMIQLNKTGFISFKGRQTVASFLIYELGVNWKIGAEYFESKLLDYDPCSNWVNWNIMANVGPEPKEKMINSVTAGKRLDPNREFIRQWIG